MAIIKDRVNEITKDDDWKQKLADEWNEANKEEAEIRKSRPRPERTSAAGQPDDVKSHVTYSKSFCIASVD